MAMAFEYSMERDGSKLTVHVIGELNATSAPTLETALQDELDELEELVLDLEKLRNISSLGLRLLLRLFKRMEKQQGVMHVVNANGVPREVLDMAGFTAIFEMGSN